MQSLSNIFWLGTKELRSVLSEVLLVAFIIYAFSLAIYLRANSAGETINNASVAIVDEDRSSLSRKLANVLYPPYFKMPDRIEVTQVESTMDQSEYIFVVVIPPHFEADLRRGRHPKIQLNIDATAVNQASLGAQYLETIFKREIDQFVHRSNVSTSRPVEVVVRRAFNPNGERSWFDAVVSLLDQLSLLTIVLTGAALLREREHGTIEHLLVMPLTALQIALAKVWANGLIILVVFTLSLTFLVQGIIGVPVAGSIWLLLFGTVIFLFAAAAIGIFLGTIARTMAQFALLVLMVILPIMMLSGGMTPIENQPDIIRPVTWLLPSRHYMSFAQSIVFRGAGFETVWPQFLTMALLGGVFLAASLAMFRRSITVSK